jgi:actin-related protein 10
LTDQLVERIITEACFASTVITRPWNGATEETAGVEDGEGEGEAKYASLKTRYMAHCDATDVCFTTQTPHGTGRIDVPGWMRERAVEVLFGDGESEDDPVHDAILSVIAKVRQFVDLLLI